MYSGASEQGAYGIPKKIGLRLKNADNANNHRNFGHPFFKLTLIFHGFGVFRLGGSPTTDLITTPNLQLQGMSHLPRVLVNTIQKN